MLSFYVLPLFSHVMTKPVLWGLRPGKTQTASRESPPYYREYPLLYVVHVPLLASTVQSTPTLQRNPYSTTYPPTQGSNHYPSVNSYKGGTLWSRGYPVE